MSILLQVMMVTSRNQIQLTGADNLSVSGHPDNNTTNREVNGSSGSSSSKLK